MQTISKSRELTTKRLVGLELPAAFSEATSSAYARVLAKKRSDRTAANVRDARRIRRQEARISRGGL